MVIERAPIAGQSGELSVAHVDQRLREFQPGFAHQRRRATEVLVDSLGGRSALGPEENLDERRDLDGGVG